MDSDGEGMIPRDVPRLIKRVDRQESKRMVFAARTGAWKNFTFKLFYQFYFPRTFISANRSAGSSSATLAVIPWIIEPFGSAVSAAVETTMRAPLHKRALDNGLHSDQAKPTTGRFFSALEFVALVVHDLVQWLSLAIASACNS